MNDYSKGSLWLDLKEFFPEFRIKYDVYLKKDDGWDLLRKGVILQETREMYKMLQKEIENRKINE